MSGPLKVLIIEDFDSDASLIIRELKKGGLNPECQVVTSPERLRESLAQTDWDIILSDYDLPGFTGLEALEIVKQQEKDIPFILLSGVIGEEVAVSAMRAGANDYLLKDKLARLVPAVERELREARNRKSLQKAQSALQNIERIRKNLVISLTHDLQTPLITQNRLLELLAEECRSLQHKGLQELVTVSLSNSVHLLKMLNYLLEIDQLEEGNIILKEEPVFLFKEAEKCIQGLDKLASDKNVRLVNLISPAGSPICGDAFLLRRLVDNLIYTALARMSKPGTVEITLQESPDEIYLEVKDDGPGIPPEHLKYVFDQSYAHSQRHQKIGISLSLFICKIIAELHGGSISVKSTLGQETVFNVRLPKKSPA